MSLRQRYGAPLALAIVLALVIKAALLYGLWYVFLSAPHPRHMRMPSVKAQQQAAPAERARR